MKLNPRQEQFVQEYLLDLNATQAAIRAGYSPKTARQQGSALLTHPAISARVVEAKAERVTRVQVEQDVVLRELLISMTSSLSHFQVDPETGVSLRDDAPPDAMRSVRSLKRKISKFGESGESQEVEITLWDKPACIGMAMKHLGLMTDRLKIEDPEGALAQLLGVKKEELP